MPVPPVSAPISHKYKEPRPTKIDPGRKHNGIDYDVPGGTEVKASTSGLVVLVEEIKGKEVIDLKPDLKKEKTFEGAYGKVIVIYHGKNVKIGEYRYTLYSHLDSIPTNVKAGAKVREGEVIGTSGNTGTKQHYYNWKGGYSLHFEVFSAQIELDFWPVVVFKDYNKQSLTCRRDPERFLEEFISDGLC